MATKESARAMLVTIRCLCCQRAPTSEEIEEMVVVFGHKLVDGDSPRLVWKCAACGNKERAAGTA
jgi:hypothetical protein